MAKLQNNQRQISSILDEIEEKNRKKRHFSKAIIDYVIPDFSRESLFLFYVTIFFIFIFYNTARIWGFDLTVSLFDEAKRSWVKEEFFSVIFLTSFFSILFFVYFIIPAYYGLILVFRGVAISKGVKDVIITGVVAIYAAIGIGLGIIAISAEIKSLVLIGGNNSLRYANFVFAAINMIQGYFLLGLIRLKVDLSHKFQDKNPNTAVVVFGIMAVLLLIFIGKFILNYIWLVNLSFVLVFMNIFINLFIKKGINRYAFGE